MQYKRRRHKVMQDVNSMQQNTELTILVSKTIHDQRPQQHGMQPTE